MKSATGIDIDPKVVEAFNDLKMGSKSGALILKIDGETITLDSVKHEHFDSVISSLPDDEPRYVLFDLPIVNRVGIEDKRMVFIFWMPMSSPVRLRVTYAGTKSVISTVLEGISMNIQMEEKDEYTLEKLQEKLMKRQGINLR